MANQSNHSRRDFFAGLAALGVAGVVGGSQTELAESLLSMPEGSSEVRLDRLRPEDFAKHVGQVFVIQDGERRLEAVLTDVTPRPRPRGWTLQRQQFSVLFRLQDSAQLPHQIYSVEHGVMGRLELFLGAVGSPATQAQVEAVFA
jgi:hypothetical protein